MRSRSAVDKPCADPPCFQRKNGVRDGVQQYRWVRCRVHRLSRNDSQQRQQPGKPSDGGPLADLLARADEVNPDIRLTYAMQIRDIKEIDALPEDKKTAAMRNVRRGLISDVTREISLQDSEGRSRGQQIEALEEIWARVKDFTPDDPG